MDQMLADQDQDDKIYTSAAGVGNHQDEKVISRNFYFSSKEWESLQPFSSYRTLT